MASLTNNEKLALTKELLTLVDDPTANAARIKEIRETYSSYFIPDHGLNKEYLEDRIAGYESWNRRQKEQAEKVEKLGLLSQRIIYGSPRGRAQYTPPVDLLLARIERQKTTFSVEEMANGFPWEDVEDARAAIMDPPPEKPSWLVSARCPSCNQELDWVYFISPYWTWEKLCGREGWLQICPTCRLQGNFVLLRMN